MQIYVVTWSNWCFKIFFDLSTPFLDIYSNRFKKGLWRKTTPKGLKLKKFIEAADGTLIHDSSYIGEDAWEDDTGSHNMKEVIERDTRLRVEDKEALKENLGISGEFCY